MSKSMPITTTIKEEKKWIWNLEILYQKVQSIE